MGQSAVTPAAPAGTLEMLKKRLMEIFGAGSQVSPTPGGLTPAQEAAPWTVPQGPTPTPTPAPALASPPPLAAPTEGYTPQGGPGAALTPADEALIKALLEKQKRDAVQMATPFAGVVSGNQ